MPALRNTTLLLSLLAAFGMAHSDDTALDMEGLSSVDDDSLQGARGKNIDENANVETLQISETEQNGTSSDNSIIGDSTHGDNSIASGVLDDNAGHVVIFQITGNQNVAQNSTTYNITLFPD